MAAKAEKIDRNGYLKMLDRYAALMRGETVPVKKSDISSKELVTLRRKEKPRHKRRRTKENLDW